MKGGSFSNYLKTSLFYFFAFFLPRRVSPKRDFMEHIRKNIKSTNIREEIIVEQILSHEQVHQIWSIFSSSYQILWKIKTRALGVSNMTSFEISEISDEIFRGLFLSSRGRLLCIRVFSPVVLSQLYSLVDGEGGCGWRTVAWFCSVLEHWVAVRPKK